MRGRISDLRAAVVVAAILFSLSPSLTLGQQRPDTLSVQPEDVSRQFDEEKLADLRNNSAFDYNVDRGQGATLWERFLNWLQRVLMALLYVGSRNSLFKIIIYAILITTVIYTVLKLLGADPIGLFRTRKDKPLAYDITEENIHVIPFEDRIAEASKDGNFRLVVRLYYLYALKILSDQGLIDWIPGKTNAEYTYELHTDKARRHFSNLTRYFDYAWYGGFEIERSLSDRTESEFKRLKRSVEK